MNPIAATLQKPTAQPDREVGSSQPEADVQNPPQGGARGGFADALRAASGQPASPRASTSGSEAAEPDGTTKTDEPAQGIPTAPPPSADPASAAAAILANILNAVTTALPAAVTSSGTGDRAGSPGAEAPAGGGAALGIALSALGSTAGPASVPGSTAGPTPVSGSTAGPASAPGATAGPTSAPGSTAGPASVPGATAGPTPVPGSTAGSASAPGATAGSASAPGSTAGSASAPGSTAGPTPVPGSTAGPTPVPGSTAGPTPVPGSTAGPTSAPDSTAGPASVPQDETVLGLTNAATASPRRDGTGPALGGQNLASQPAVGPLPASPPKVTVLDRAAHFKPVLPNAAPIPTPIPEAGPGPADGAKLQRAQTELPALITAAAAKGPAQGSAQSAPQTASDPAGAAVRAAGAGLEKADVTALSDIRAVSGIARAGLDSDKRSGEAETAGAQAPGATGLGLPAGTLPTLASAIRDEVAHVTASEPAAQAPQTDQAVQTTPDGPLRVLRIQLKPDDLGTVTVELRLANGQLETHLRASEPETAALLHRDAAILTDLLKQANYQAEVTVSQARPSDSGGFSGNAPSQGQPGFSEGGARSGQGGDRQRQADRSPAAGRREGERGDETIRPRDGGVYL